MLWGFTKVMIGLSADAFIGSLGVSGYYWLAGTEPSGLLGSLGDGLMILTVLTGLIGLALLALCAIRTALAVLIYQLGLLVERRIVL